MSGRDNHHDPGDIEAVRARVRRVKEQLRQTAETDPPRSTSTAGRALRDHPVGMIAAAAASGAGLAVFRRPAIKLLKASAPLARVAGRAAVTYALARQRRRRAPRC